MLWVEKTKDWPHSKDVKLMLEKKDRGFWDGRSQINGTSGCGVVIQGVGRNMWITLSKISVPWVLVRP